METHFTNFDYVVIGVMTFSCLFAFFRGLVREVLSLVAWVGAGIFTIAYFAPVAEKLQPHFKNPAIVAGIATIGLYLVALIVLSIINMMIIKTIKSGNEAGMLDNLLGLGFGALRGALIVSFGFFLLTVAWPQKEYPEWLEKSVTRPYAEQGALMLAAAAPRYLRDVSLMQKKAIERMRENRENQPQDDEEDTGYNPRNTRQTDRLFDHSERSQ